MHEEPTTPILFLTAMVYHNLLEDFHFIPRTSSILADIAGVLRAILLFVIEGAESGEVHDRSEDTATGP